MSGSHSAVGAKQVGTSKTLSRHYCPVLEIDRNPVLRHNLLREAVRSQLPRGNSSGMVPSIR